VLEQKKPQDEQGVLGRTSDVGEVFKIFILQLFPGNEFSNAKPAVPFIEAAAEGEEFGKKNLYFTVFGLVHGADSRVKVHGFRGVIAESMHLEHGIHSQNII
jgi:hypothetical protein